MADLAKIVEDLSNLTVLEAAELSKMLEEKWGVSAAAPVAVAAVAGGGAAADWTCGWATYKELNVSCLVETKDVANYINSIKLFPTVANDHATLQLNLVENADLTVEIYSLNGQYIGQQVNERAFAGEQTYSLNTSDLANGFYFVRIQANDAVATEKLIIVR